MDGIQLWDEEIREAKMAELDEQIEKLNQEEKIFTDRKLHLSLIFYRNPERSDIC